MAYKTLKDALCHGFVGPDGKEVQLPSKLAYACPSKFLDDVDNGFVSFLDKAGFRVLMHSDGKIEVAMPNKGKDGKADKGKDREAR